MKDFALAIMNISGLLMAVFVGIGLIQKEIQRKTVLTLLAKPFPRWHFILGKYLGLCMVLSVNIIMMTGFFYLILWLTNSNPTWGLLLAIYMLILEMGIVVAVALLFSSFSTPFLSALFTLGVYIAGHLSGDILHYMENMQKFGNRLPGAVPMPSWMVKLAEVLYYIIPNLENFNIKGRIVHHLAVPGSLIGFSTIYAIFFIALFLTIASLWFNKRDFI
jgi:ABC-type transport system involved in multi-copper enzyme maturation permease subunit